ncbi:MAG TPA: hypothetical protein DCS63_04010 [Elusimicrobia bacterium]|nr:hypothetical protein [Elusimicrobiota bacterium]
MAQQKQNEWREQWEMLQDGEQFLFRDWILPSTLEDFRDKDVLECGCGGGQHTSFIAPFVRSVTAVDLNAAEVARQRNKDFKNVSFVEADIAEMDLGRQFDIVFSIGVIHHTDDPEKTVANMVRHTKPGGRVIIWVYSKEGNSLVEHGVEPLRKAFLRDMSRKNLLRLSKLIGALMYPPIYTVYLLPLGFLPFYEYFQNFRKMSFDRNVLNIFDKLNAPQVQFMERARVQRWLPAGEFRDISITPYKGVSWRVSGVKR